MKNPNQPTKNVRVPRKAWSYKQLTQATEANIRGHAEFLKKQLASRPDDLLNHITVSQVSSWAYGSFNLWQSLTFGWQEPGDEERLRALADSLECSGNVQRGQA